MYFAIRSDLEAEPEMPEMPPEEELQRMVNEEPSNRRSQEILAEFQAQGFEIDGSHASLGMVYTQKEQDEDGQSPQA